MSTLEMVLWISFGIVTLILPVWTWVAVVNGEAKCPESDAIVDQHDHAEYAAEARR